MKINYNKNIIRRLVAANTCLILLTTTLSGCVNNTQEQVVLETVDMDEEDIFVKYEDFNFYKWYILKYTDGNYMMSRTTVMDKKSQDITIYYFIDVFDGYDVKGKIIYNRYDKDYCILAGNEIESAISVEDFVNEIGFLQDKYTIEDMKYIYNEAIENFNKKPFEKDKVYIKNNLKSPY